MIKCKTRIKNADIKNKKKFLRKLESLKKCLEIEPS